MNILFNLVFGTTDLPMVLVFEEGRLNQPLLLLDEHTIRELLTVWETRRIFLTEDE